MSLWYLRCRLHGRDCYTIALNIHFPIASFPSEMVPPTHIEYTHSHRVTVGRLFFALHSFRTSQGAELNFFKVISKHSVKSLPAIRGGVLITSPLIFKLVLKLYSTRRDVRDGYARTKAFAGLLRADSRLCRRNDLSLAAIHNICRVFFFASFQVVANSSP